MALDRDIEAIEELLHEHPEIRFLTFDPLASYLGDGVTIILANHLNKASD